MTQHTPGPWEVIAVDWTPEGNARFEIQGITGTGMADARLIAAAPELLAALENVMANPTTFSFEPIRAAIAKATGEVK